MKYYGIHVTYGKGDSDGYTIPAAIEKGDEEDAINMAIDAGLFVELEDVDNVDYVEELSEEDYKNMTFK